MTSQTSPVWFITGCSRGLGRELAKLVIERGWCAVLTARDKAHVADLADSAVDRTLALDLDITDTAQIKAAVIAAETRFGRIDVLVNNAGYGYQASIEEGDDAQIRAQFEANVFGLFAMTRAVLPGMRTQRKGHIINISSVAGLIGYPGSGYYAASKHAVEGWSDALAAEGKPLGVKVTCIEPGPFRTDWAGSSLRHTESQILDYADTAGARIKSTAHNSGHQPGDPTRAAQAMIKIAECESPPRHLVLGAWGVDAVEKRLQEKLAEITAWRETGIAADFPKV